MGASGAKTTTITKDGQVILPQSVRDSRHWVAGTTLAIEETPDGILLRKVQVFPQTRYEDVAGMLKYEGKAKTIEEMNEAVLDEAQRRFDRSRY